MEDEMRYGKYLINTVLLTVFFFKNKNIFVGILSLLSELKKNEEKKLYIL